MKNGSTGNGTRFPLYQEELNQILAEGEEMLERVNKLIESHPDIAASY